MRRTIWWIRRDLRLSDNPALSRAISEGSEVIPLFIMDPLLLNSGFNGEKRIAFLLAGLQNLDLQLRTRNSFLVIRRGDALEELSRMVYENGVTSIIAEPDYSPYAVNRDQRISSQLPIQWIGSPSVHPPGSILKSDGSPYIVFTPFSKAWKSLHLSVPMQEVTTQLNFRTSKKIPSYNIPKIGLTIPFLPGEDEAKKKLSNFSQIGNDPSFPSPPAIYQYNAGRNQLDVEGTSQLSPYLRFGMVSARQVVFAAEKAIQNGEDQYAKMNAESWLNELIWREFYIHILHFFPYVRQHNFRNINIIWENSLELFKVWKNGETGYPIIDAAMRQLIETGWIHNRARMVVASFLTKDLLIDWRWGEKWFMQHLIDGDPAANNGGWQWVAGSGTDAAPFFRIFNPIHQAKKFDALGNFVCRWIPELRLVPGEYIHEPWKMPLEIQQRASCVIGRDYPSPIVDHYWARQRALQAFQNYQKKKNLSRQEA